MVAGPGPGATGPAGFPRALRHGTRVLEVAALRASNTREGDERNGLWVMTCHADVMDIEPNIFARAVRRFDLAFESR